MLSALRKGDRSRVQLAAKKILERTRMRRRKLRAEKKSKKDDTVTYKAGSFGFSSQPEDLSGPSGKKRKTGEPTICNKRKKLCSMQIDPSHVEIENVTFVESIVVPLTFVDDLHTTVFYR